MAHTKAMDRKWSSASILEPCAAMQLILVGTGAATIWIMPFMDYWDNVISITSMGGRPRSYSLLVSGYTCIWEHPQTMATTFSASSDDLSGTYMKRP